MINPKQSNNIFDESQQINSKDLYYFIMNAKTKDPDLPAYPKQSLVFVVCEHNPMKTQAILHCMLGKVFIVLTDARSLRGVVAQLVDVMCKN